MADERNLGSEELFKAQLGRNTQGNFLGDWSCVESLVRRTISKFVETYEQAGGEEGRKTVAKREAQDLARILLGQDRNFQPLHRWNEPGKIDVFCAKWLGIKSTDPEERMEHAVIKLFVEVVELAEIAGENGILDEQWVWQLDAMVQRFTGIFVGVDLPTQAALSISNEEPKEDVGEE